VYTAFESVSTIRIGEIDQRTGKGFIEFGMPVNITNRGVLPISDILLKLKVSDVKGIIVFEGNSSKITLFPRESQRILLNVKMDFSQLDRERLATLMTEVKGFITAASIQATIQPFVNFNLTVYGRMDWEAPYGDLEINEPTMEFYNTTHVTLDVPLAFRNKSNFFINGTVSICIMDMGRCAGFEQMDLRVRPGEDYNGRFEVKLKLPWVVDANPELLVSGLKRTYNIVLNLPAPIVEEFEIEKNATIEWGAPLSNLRVGEPIETLYNDTHVKILVPLSFNDASIFPISGSIKTVFFDGSGNLIGESLELPFSAEPGSKYIGAAIGYVSKSQQRPIRVEILLNTPYGLLERSVNLIG